jgi:hypothetical protein
MKIRIFCLKVIFRKKLQTVRLVSTTCRKNKKRGSLSLESSKDGRKLIRHFFTKGPILGLGYGALYGSEVQTLLIQ